ncbi:hypothetical protein PanWU01x14_157920, partial [Parasponia andersonii]
KKESGYAETCRRHFVKVKNYKLSGLVLSPKHAKFIKLRSPTKTRSKVSPRKAGGANEQLV